MAFMVSKQRGVFSEVLNPSLPQEYAVKDVSLGPDQQLIMSTLQKQQLPKAISLNKLPSRQIISRQTKFQSTDRLANQTRNQERAKKQMLQVSSVEPKAILPFDPIPGQVPRKVAIDRKRKEFKSIDFETLLAQVGVDFNKSNPQVEWVPLEYFDDSSFDDNSTQDWILRQYDEDGQFHPLLGKGLHKEPDGQFKYQPLMIMEYDAHQERYKGRWTTTEEDVSLHRLYICFDAEDPRNYVIRVANAFQQRIYADSLVRYNYLIDNMPLHDLSELDTEQKKRIEALAKTKKLENMETTALTLEVNSDFGRTMNKIIFDRYLEEQKEDELFPSYLQLPPPPPPKEVPYFGMMELERTKGVKEKSMFRYDEITYADGKDFTETFKDFCFASLFIKEEVIKALQDIRVQCNNLLNQQIFQFEIEEAMHLDQFKHIQESSTSQIMYYLKGTWINAMVNIIKEQFKDVGKGWFNMKETSKITYDFGKLKRFLTVIRLMMQDTLLSLILNNFYRYATSIRNFIPNRVEIKNTNHILNYYSDGQVTDTTKQNHSKHRKRPLFQIELIKHSIEDSFVYSTNPTNFVMVVIHAIKKALDEMAKVPDLEPKILADLYKSQKLETFIKAPMMPHHEPNDPDPNERPRKFPDENKWVWVLYYDLKKEMELAIKPLQDYLSAFDQFLGVLQMRPDDYTREMELRDPPPEIEQIREEILITQQREKKLKELIPDIVHVSIFEVHLKETLLILEERYQTLRRNLIDLIARRARSQSIRLFQEIGDIRKKIEEEPTNIEKLTELKEYIQNIPSELEKTKFKMNQIFDIFKILEDFSYRFSKEDMQRRWNIFASPREIQSLVDQRKGQIEKLKAKFSEDMKISQDDFKEQFENLERTISNFHHHQNLQQHQNVAEIVEYVLKQLQEFQEQARKFNNQELLFEREQTDYSKLSQMIRDFQPYANLWISANRWFVGKQKWLNDEWEKVNAEEAERVVEDGIKNLGQVIRFMRDREITGVMKIGESVKAQLDEFRPKVPLLLALRKKGMTDRHWDQVSIAMNINPPLRPNDDFTFAKALELGLMEQVERIVDIGETAGKEYAIEQMLESMQSVWENVKFQVVPYKQTTYIIRGYDEIQIILDEHIVNTQAMVFSPYKKFFEDRILEWDKSLKKISDILEEWAKFQQQWMYLQPIFDSQDIAKQLPAETKKFKTVDQTWRTTVTQAKAKEKVLAVCTEEGLWERIHEANKNLELIQKELNNYLEKKREKFARFYFLSDDELLEILSQTKEPTAVQPHLKKVFENIHSIEFDKDKKIHAMFSAEKERVQFAKVVDPNKKNVEDWMNEVENMMRQSVRLALFNSIEHYPKIARKEWVLLHPGQCVLNGSQVHWTKEVEDAIKADNIKRYHEFLGRQQEELVDLVRTKLSKQAMVTINALIVIDVHAKDVVQKLVEANVNDLFAFEWISQLRYYWEGTPEQDCFVKCVQTNFPYGYEYLGNTLRLVITPLTDKCYMTLMGALRLNLGGAPAGPAGTGKTESTKDLAKALAKQCVVFNCSDSMDFIMVGKFFKGLASAGAWACFDEFNRINIEVLSVIAQQLLVLFGEKAKGTPQVEFEGSLIKLLPTFSVFITMNPGYAGRTELPDNLKALFRPVAMMVPDYAMIGEIMLYSFGFKLGRSLAKKMVATFKLSSEQLSSQDHYDYGMRAVRSVINAAGLLKVQSPDMDEEQLLLRALRDVNVPKFLKDDLPLFDNIILDLFPGVDRPKYNYGDLLPEVRRKCEEYQLQAVQPFMDKIAQLFDTIQVRHGLMLVGPTGGAKTTNYNILSKSLTALGEDKGFYRVHLHILNPKSITMGQLYGQFNEQTHEWTDGVLAFMVREAVKDQSSDRHWIMFDGPVDALWIESMNTVLDDNKKLCLNSGQILTLTPYMTMMFEVEDLAVASPATVSRCGMVYMEPNALGIEPLIKTWLQRIPSNIATKRTIIVEKLTRWFDQYIETGIEFMRKNCKEVIGTMNNNIIQSMFRIINSLIAPYVETELKKVSNEDLDILEQSIEYIFQFSLIWSIYCTVDWDGRQKLNQYHKKKLEEFKSRIEIPEEGTIYDYQYSFTERKFISWKQNYQSFEIDPKLGYHEIMIPTNDSTRNMAMIKLLLTNGYHVLCPGPTGTGKSQNAYTLLVSNMPEEYQYIALTFSAQTSANQTQDTIDVKMDKRRKGVFGPPVGKKCIIFVDDLNMPKKEEYGAQPPIELLRQFLDHAGWYNRKELNFMRLEDLILLGAMGPPGGGRSQITGRMVRHFNVIAYTELEEEIIKQIFISIASFFFTKHNEAVRSGINNMIDSVLKIYNRVREDLLPTPSKSHYTFNLRDISKVFQGICAISVKDCQELAQLVRLWYHENMRVFHDRLINDQDRIYLKQLLESFFPQFGFKIKEDVLDCERILFCDFLANRDSDNRPYQQITGDMQLFVQRMEGLLEEYNSDMGSGSSKKQMKLVMFLDACEHICRIARILRQPSGNALLLGIGGSGRQSLTKLATFLSNYKLQQIEVIKNYNMRAWRDDVKRILMSAGIENKQITFLFVDTQIINEQMLEDINNILNSGDVTNIYNEKDMEDIMNACKAECIKKQLQPNKMNIFTLYLARVKKNMHIVIAMSPIGDAFTTRLRMFPSLVNCSTIDWFTEWPEEALEGVGRGQLIEQADELGIDVRGTRLVDMFKYMHKSVERISVQYREELRRINYVTPTSYLELLNLYKQIVDEKRKDLKSSIQRLKNGLDKLQAANVAVEDMKVILEKMQPELEQAQIDTQKTMEFLKVEKEEADQTQRQVAKEEIEATKQAEEANELAQQAEESVREANEQLEATMAKVKELKKEHLTEIKSLSSPPEAIRVVLAGVVILNTDLVKKVGEIIMQNIPGQIGKKEENYFETAKRYLLTDPKELLDILMKYDKDSVKQEYITKIEQKVLPHPKFNQKDATGASLAAGYLFGWVKCIYDYYNVYTSTKPQREKLAQMKSIVEEKTKELAIKKEALERINNKIRALQQKFEEKKKQQEDLSKKIRECEVKLERAQKLTEGLSEEKIRWSNDVEKLGKQGDLIPGDAVIAAGMVAYCGPFISQYRQKLEQDWRQTLVDYKLTFSNSVTMRSFLGDEVKIQTWNIAGLPKDDTSIENGIIIDKSRRWPLMIDPQSQANKYIKNLGRDQPEGIDIMKVSDPNLMRTLELAIQFGKWVLVENVGVTLDPSLEPVLLQQVVKQGASYNIQIGDKNLSYNESFRFFMTTTLPNPHYSPETSVKVTIINFAITALGLEEQMLAQIVALENPNLENKKTEIVRKNAADKKELVSIEDSILRSLSETKGDISEILMDETLINKLQNSKKFAAEINQRVKDSKVTEAQIDEARESYRPVAYRANLSTIDPMYQYSLQWFINLFSMGVQNAAPSTLLEERLENLNSFFTYSLYENVCRSLFEKHKLLFSFLLTKKILSGSNNMNENEWRFLLTGATGDIQIAVNPTTWISENQWPEIYRQFAGMDSNLDAFKGIEEDFLKNPDRWIEMWNDPKPEDLQFPEPWQAKLDTFERIILIKAIRSDKVIPSIQKWIIEKMNEKFIIAPTFDIGKCYKDSTNVTPLIFVLSPGSDPIADLMKFAEEMNMVKRIDSISLGQGQGPKAEKMVKDSTQKGGWVLLMNCHLAVSWMPELQKLCEELEETLHKDFRLWLTSMPSKDFPTSVLQNGVKMTLEPPKGLRNNLLRTYTSLDDKMLIDCKKPEIFRKLLFGFCLFHAIIQERRKFGPIGWNIPYEFTNEDLTVCRRQLKSLLDDYIMVPYKVINYLGAEINYGGRVTDDKDVRLIKTILKVYICQEATKDNFQFLSPVYLQPPAKEIADYIAYIEQLPLNPAPDAFGMHENADITNAQNETRILLETLLSIQPRQSTGAGKSREDQIVDIANFVQSKCPELFDIDVIGKQYPTDYAESMNTVLVQELIRYNRLIAVIRVTLVNVKKALKGLIVMSEELEKISNSLYANQVPVMWADKGFLSLKPLGSWTQDLLDRITFLSNWIDNGTPKAFWISGFFFPQAFVTGTLQNYARKHIIAIDKLSFEFRMMDNMIVSEIDEKPEDGCYVHGIFLEGAKWDYKRHIINQPKAKELYSDLPITHLVPFDATKQTQIEGGEVVVQPVKEKPKNVIYNCPIYKVVSRVKNIEGNNVFQAGTLSTTGHSTNFVMFFELPSKEDEDTWIRAGVAGFLSLRY